MVKVEVKQHTSFAVFQTVINLKYIFQDEINQIIELE